VLNREDHRTRSENFSFAQFIPSPDDTPVPVILEHRGYDDETESNVQRSSDYIAQISNRADPERFNVPKCLGYFQETISSRFTLIFARHFSVRGMGKVHASGYTLADSIDLLQSFRARKMTLSVVERTLIKYLDDLESRKNFAVQLVRALSYIHAVGLVHKSLRSANIVLWVDTETSTHVIPLIFGFDRARLVSEISAKAEDVLWESRLYRHPARWRENENLPFVREYDVYSLGVILLELGMGRLAKSIAPYRDLVKDLPHLSLSTDDQLSSETLDAALSQKLSSAVVERFIREAERLQAKQGPTFYNAVKNCLLFGRDQQPASDEMLSDILDSLMSLRY